MVTEIKILLYGESFHRIKIIQQDQNKTLMNIYLFVLVAGLKFLNMKR